MSNTQQDNNLGSSTFPTSSWVDPASQNPTDSLQGATSADVDQGLGKPISNMSSAEEHHDGKPHRKREGVATDQFAQTKEMNRARAEALEEKE